MTELKTKGALNKLQPRIPKSLALQVVENPSCVRPPDYGTGAVILDRDGVAWQRDIDNLVDEALQLPGRDTYWWKVASAEDYYTSGDIPLPAKLLEVSDV